MHEKRVDYFSSVYGTFSELVSAPYAYRILTYLKPNFSITTRQKLKVKLYYDRSRSVLQKCIYILNFCRVVFENFDLKLWLKYGTGSGTKSLKLL